MPVSSQDAHMVSRKRQRPSPAGSPAREIVRELEHGRDICVDELSREHIRSFADTLKHLPAACAGKDSLRAGWLQLADMGRSGQIEWLLMKTMEVRQTNVPVSSTV